MFFFSPKRSNTLPALSQSYEKRKIVFHGYLVLANILQDRDATNLSWNWWVDWENQDISTPEDYRIAFRLQEGNRSVQQSNKSYTVEKTLQILKKD